MLIRRQHTSFGARIRLVCRRYWYDSARPVPMAALAVLLALFATPRSALAHARLVHSNPENGAHVTAPPRLIQLWFSEAAAATLTHVTLRSDDGARIAVGSTRPDSANPLLLTASVESDMPPGAYTLAWSTVAEDDGHPSHGTITFVVGPATGPYNSLPPSPLASAGPTALPTPIATGSMDVESGAYILSRWLNLVAIITIIGAVAFRVLVVPAVVRGDASGQSAAFAPIAMRAAARLGLLGGGAALIGSAGRLAAERLVAGEGTHVSTLLHTSWGHVWLAQLVLGVAACAAFATAVSAITRRLRLGSWIAAGIVALLIGAAPAMSGHAMGASAYRDASVTLDVVHVLAAGGWLGGLLAVALAGVPAALSVSADTDLAGGLPLIARVVNAFSPTALAFAGCVVVTGGIAGWLRVGSLAQLFSTSYGKTLLIKLALVALVLAGGAFNWLRMRRSLTHYESETAAVMTFRRTAWLELVTGAFVIVATAVLVALQPPVH
ncbi:MAG: copper resistance protein CopC [Gemmatimonadota bacterium]|nr:copper resistance protein CopC [Gemmatimonadota bacterium]